MLNPIIQSITNIDQHGSTSCDYSFENNYKLNIEPNFTATSLSLKIKFNVKISQFRNINYQWEELSGIHYCKKLSPKIIYLENNLYIQANCSIGIWEIKASQPDELYWHFNQDYIAPVLRYHGSQKNKQIINTYPENITETKISLLCSPSNGLELSRSQIPFSAIACFTDHCDFDTEMNLKIQRQFFKTLNIKITKGFFLNHYSKRDQNASWENNSTEYLKWLEDGHELAYHSLSQSIKPLEESLKDFKSFLPPVDTITTWIDHGYQPYNLSLNESFPINTEEYFELLESKGITIFWNYIDAGISTRGVINQLNPSQFTLKKCIEGTKNLSNKDRFRFIIKSIFNNLYIDEKSSKIYKQTLKSTKQFITQKKIKHLKVILSNTPYIFSKILSLVLNWNSIKNKSYPLAKNSPILYTYRKAGQTFNAFQTIEMVDFNNSLCEENIDLLIKEKGIFIAHTYFSVPHKYHTGRLLTSENEINQEVQNKFSYLSNKISEKSIWNPTLQELSKHLNGFLQQKFDCDSSGEICLISKNSNLISRKVKIIS